MNNRLLLTLVGLLGLAACASAQPLRQWVRFADSTFAKRDFHAAYKYSEAALRIDPSRMDLWHVNAESAFEFQAYPAAVRGYQRILDSDQRSQYPRTLLRMAQAYQMTGNYEQAALLFQRFIDEQPGADPADLDAADKGLRDLRFAKQLIQNPADLIASNLGDSINSPFSDFGAVYRGDTLYYTSFKFPFLKDKHKPQRRLHRIMISVQGKQGQPLPDYFNEPGKHVAHTAFNHDFSRMYYTVCEYTSDNEIDIRCEVYFRERADQGWGPAKRLAVNVDGYTTTQPAIGRDLETGEETLFFSSDRPGGVSQGGRRNMDIWYAILQPDGSCSTPVNLTALNTPGNDVTPFFHNPSQTLYFSSDGYPGLGGYDIFQSFKRGTGWDAPQHMGQTFNSNAHDVYFVLNDEGTHALLASNRAGAALLDKRTEVCCYDVWEIELAQLFILDVLTFSKPDSAALAGVTVEVFELTPQGEQRLVNTLTNPDANDFSFKVSRGKKYLVKGAREGYLPASETIDLNDAALAGKEGAEVKLYLEPAPVQLNALTFRLPDGEPLPGATVKLYEILPGGTEKLIDSKENPRANDFNFALTPGRKYALKATRPGYSPASETFDLNDPELAGKPVVEKKLYLAPAPLRLEVLALRETVMTPLRNATVTLVELMPDGRQIVVDSLTNPTSHEFRFPVESGKIYEIRGIRPPYRADPLRLDLSRPESIPSDGLIRKELIFKHESSLLTAISLNSIDNNRVNGARLTALRVNPDGTREQVRTSLDPLKSEVTWELEQGYVYEITAEKDGFTPDTKRVDLTTGSGLTIVQLYLTPSDQELEVTTFRRIDGTPLPKVNINFLEVKPSGERMLIYSRINPDGNDVRFPIQKDKQYELQAERPGYSSATETLDMRDPALRNQSLVKKQIFLDPAASTTLQVLAEDRDSRPVIEATVSLLEALPQGRENRLEVKSNDESNDFYFPVERGKNYVIRGTHQDYLDAMETLDLRSPENLPDTIQKILVFLKNTQIKAETFHAVDLQPLAGVTVTVYSVEPDGTRTQLAVDFFKPEFNEYEFVLPPGFVYEIKGEKDGYTTDIKTLDLRDNPPGPVSVKLYLRPIEQALEVTTFRRADGSKLPGVQVELFEIRPSGERAFINSRTNPDNNDVQFPVERNKNYLLSATRAGYLPAVETLNMSDPALRDQALVRKQMFLEQAQVNLEVLSLRRADNAPIKGSTVSLYEVRPDGQETLLSSQTNRDGNDFTFPLATGKQYVVRGEHPAYHPTQARIDLRDPATAASGTIRRELLFDQPLPVRVFDQQTGLPLAGARIELRELDDPRSRSTYKENPNGNDFIFPVLPGKRYLLSADRPGYHMVQDTIPISPDPNRPIDTVKVYLRPVDNPVDLLPLNLFFDNDQPNPRSTLSTTTLDYGQTYAPYYARKQKFIEEFSKGDDISENDRFLLEQDYDRFFEREVRGGYRDLEAFSIKLLAFLQAGNSVQIELRGYTSPRGTSEYNLILSRRRVSCVNNHFLRYDNGVLLPFIRSGKLVIDKSPRGVKRPELKWRGYDDDTKASIYSIPACIDRSVEIVGVKVTQNSN